MNYRHAFHAGGFADVIKHIVLVRMLTYLQEKQAPFRVIDTHAGAGRYDLTGDEAPVRVEGLVAESRHQRLAVTRSTSSIDVTPARTFATPSSIIVRMPSLRA